MRQAFLILSIFLALVPVGAYAELGDTNIVSAEVVRIVNQHREIIPGTSTEVLTQTIEIQFEDGTTAVILNDRIPLAEGDTFYVRSEEGVDGQLYTVHDADRRGAVLFAVILFAIVTISIGRWVGFRALIALGVSLVLILYGLVPLLTSGYSPILICALGAAVILGIAMLITHGVNRVSAAAYAASILVIFLATVLGEYVVDLAHLTGFSDSAAGAVNISLGNSVNMSGLLLGGLIIGVLGIIDDLAVTQVVTVAELKSTDPSLTAKTLYVRAMRVGREHLGAVVNTLVLAYAGASLPLLLLFSLAPAPLSLLINSEVIAVEIVRAAVGGTALVLVVPVATYLGIFAFTKPGKPGSYHTHPH